MNCENVVEKPFNFKIDLADLSIFLQRIGHRSGRESPRQGRRCERVASAPPHRRAAPRGRAKEANE